MRNLQRVAPLESKVASRRVFLSFLPTLTLPWHTDAGHVLNTKDGKSAIAGIGLKGNFSILLDLSSYKNGNLATFIFSYNIPLSKN
jgi:hypothetical protein